MLGFSTTKIFKLGGMILILFGCPVSGGYQRSIGTERRESKHVKPVKTKRQFKHVHNFSENYVNLQQDGLSELISKLAYILVYHAIWGGLISTNLKELPSLH